MTKFILRILATFFAAALLLEIVLRVFSLAGHTLPTKNIDGDLLLKPGENGYWVKGGFREIASHYSINPQGWNNIRDYKADNEDTSLMKIAIVGDSYIEGFHVDVERSIGRQLEHLLGTNYVVHEFGRSGGNIVDFARVYQKFNLFHYKYVFVLVTYKDLIAKKPSFMGQGKKIPAQSLIRRIYNNLVILRYLNINHGFNSQLKEMFKFGGEKHEKESAVPEPEKVNQEALRDFGPNAQFLYEKDKINTNILQNIPYPTILIDHKLRPIDCGFDGHWNLNGRINCAKSIAKFIKISEK